MIINSNLTNNFTKKLGITLTAGALLFSAPAVGSNSLEKQDNKIHLNTVKNPQFLHQELTV